MRRIGRRGTSLSSSLSPRRAIRTPRHRSGDEPGNPVPNRQDCLHSQRLQIVGFKNSGKTTLTEALLKLALDLGLRTSAIKHHGHGGTPDLPPETTDASRFFEAGAVSSLVVGGDVILLQGRPKPEAQSLPALIQWTESYAQPDLILIEGFKEEAFPKIVLIRSLADWASLQSLSHIHLIVAVSDEWIPLLMEQRSLKDAAIPILTRDQHEDIAVWFTDWLKRRLS